MGCGRLSVVTAAIPCRGGNRQGGAVGGMVEAGRVVRPCTATRPPPHTHTHGSPTCSCVRHATHTHAKPPTPSPPTLRLHFLNTQECNFTPPPHTHTHAPPVPLFQTSLQPYTPPRTLRPTPAGSWLLTPRPACRRCCTCGRRCTPRWRCPSCSATRATTAACTWRRRCRLGWRCRRCGAGRGLGRGGDNPVRKEEGRKFGWIEELEC